MQEVLFSGLDWTRCFILIAIPATIITQEAATLAACTDPLATQCQSAL